MKQKKELSEEQLVKKAKRKKVLKIVIVIVAVLIVLSGIIASPLLIYVGKELAFRAKVEPDNIELIDISMTPEERLADFEYIYQTAVIGNPSYKDFEALYGIDFEELYEYYKPLVENAESDFDYYCLVFTFMRNMPSGHTVLSIPSYTKQLGTGFMLTRENLEQKNMDRYCYSWEQCLRESIAEYQLDPEDKFDVAYFDGEYAVITQNEYYGAKILDINGETPDEFCMHPLNFYALEYDDLNDKVFRNGMMFNDTYGDEIKLTVKLPSGEEKVITTYYDYQYVIAYQINYNYQNIDKSKHATEKSPDDEENETASSEEAVTEDDFSDEMGDYYFVEDDERDLVYLSVRECGSGKEAEAMQECLRDALTRHDTIIIDFRNNGGGSETFFGNYMYPELFMEDYSIPFEVNIENNEATKKFINSPMQRLFYRTKKVDGEDYYRIIDEYEMSGNATKEYDIYLLTSESTFSAAATATYIMSQKDNVTIVGTYTGGEGTDGPIFFNMTPVGHLPIAFCPGKNTDASISDSVVGVAPDYPIDNTIEVRMYRQELENQGEAVASYESRLKWDKQLQKTLELIDEK